MACESASGAGSKVTSCSTPATRIRPSPVAWVARYQWPSGPWNERMNTSSPTRTSQIVTNRPTAPSDRRGGVSVSSAGGVGGKGGAVPAGHQGGPSREGGGGGGGGAG